MFTGPGIFFRWLNSQYLQVFFKLLDMTFAKCRQIPAGCFGSPDDPVVQIVDVYDMAHAISPKIQIATQQIGKYIASHLSDMHSCMRRGSIGINAHISRNPGFECLLVPAQCIKKFQTAVFRHGKQRGTQIPFPAVRQNHNQRSSGKLSGDF